MVHVLSIALLMGWFVALRSYVGAWEARRVELYRQHDAAMAAGDQMLEIAATAGRTAVARRIGGTGKSRTADWTVWAEAYEDVNGRKPLIRVAAFGRNGRLSSELDPIRIETYGAPLDDAWIEVFQRTCRERGWTYEIVRAAPAASFPPPPP
ncbi:hypothetical protein [Paludisphaera rhizosphaerae]|nr:hypothetical protein [Paludisphaera rhizosphaerae]